jgi:signal transduction histidine kinase
MPKKRTNEDSSRLRERVAELEAERAALEEQVRNLNRVKTTMDLLAGVAHDLAAALTGVVWCSQALCRRLQAHDPELSEGVADFVGAADFARQLARRLVSISRQPDVATDEYELRVVFAEAMDLLETLRPPKVRLHASYEADAQWVHGNADQLQQIVINLVANAFDALQDREGTVEVTLSASAAPARDTQAEVSEHGWARLSVYDDGRGMDDATLKRAFEPFFTTKEAQGGSGMGLVVVERVVERHGGVLRVESNLGCGTKVDVYLPRIAAPHVASEA